MATTKKKAPVKNPTKKKDISNYQPATKVKPQGKFESNEMLQSDEMCNEVLQKEKKPIKLTANQLAYDMLRQQGLTKSQAVKQLGLSKSFATWVEKKTKPDYAEVIAGLMPSSLKVIKKLSTGKPVGQMSDIKGSDVIAANKMIWDRVAPVTSDAPVVQHQSFTQVNFNVIPVTQNSINSPSIDVNILPVSDSK